MSEEPAPSPEELLKQAHALELARDLPGALALLDRLVALHPEHRAALLERARLRLIREDRKGAIADLSLLLTLDPNHLRAYFYRAMAQAPTDLPSALSDYRRAADLEPQDGVGYYIRGLAKESLNRPAEAKADFDRALALIPEGDPWRLGVVEKVGVRSSQPLKDRIQAAPVTFALIGINALVMACFPKLWGDPSVADLIAAGALERYAVWSGEAWRMFTSIFLHIGVMHLAWNGFASVSLCTPVEKALGSRRFLICYLLTGLGASATSLLAHHVTAAGSSGALFGIQGVFLYSFRHRLGSWGRFFEDRTVRAVLKNTGIWFLLGMTVLPMDNYAHAGGLVFGLLLGWLFLGTRGWGRVGRIAAWTGGLGALVFVCTLAAFPVGPGSGVYRGYLDHLEGLKALTAGDLDRAEAKLRGALEAGYRDPAAYIGYGSLLYERRDYARAAEQYEKAIKIDSSSADAYYGRGLCKHALGDPVAALEDYRKALALAPPTWDLRAAAQKLVDELGRK